MADYTELLDCYSGDVLGLMKTFIGRLRSDADRRSYAAALRLFHDITGTDPLTASEDTFSRYVQALQKKTSAPSDGKKAWKHSTALKNRKILSSFVRYCAKIKEQGSDRVPGDFEDRLMYSPMRNVSDGFRYNDIVAVSDIDRLYCHLRDSGDLRLMCAFIFSFRCFLRPVNFIGAAFSDIHVDRAGEYFLDAKGRSALVHIPKDCVPYIEAYEKTRHGRFLFGKKQADGPVDITYLDGRLRKACRDAGCEAEGLTLNSLRNSATVYALSNGATPGIMADALDLQTASHFTRLSSLTVHFDYTHDYVGITFRPASGHADTEGQGEGK